MLDSQSALTRLSTAVERSFDAREFNRILNDPAVRPHVGFPEAGSLDITPILENEDNFYLAADGGAILFAADLEPGIYEVHVNFLENHRGRHAIECIRNADRWMFTHTNCWRIVARVPGNNRLAAMAARAVGLKHKFTRKNIWPVENGSKKIDCKFYALDYEDWLEFAAHDLIIIGREFRVMLDRERRRHGVEDAGHPDEDCRNLQAGAFLEMVYGGQMVKGAGAADVGAHGIQTRLRVEAQDLLRSSTGSDRIMGKALMDARDQLVDAIDQAANGNYKPGLKAYHDEMRIQFSARLRPCEQFAAEKREAGRAEAEKGRSAPRLCCI